MGEETSKFLIASIFIATLIACGIKFLKWIWFNPKKFEKIMRSQGLRGIPYRLLVGDSQDAARAANQAELRPAQLDDHLPSHIHSLYCQLLKKYGRNCFTWLGPKLMVTIVEPELVKEILSSRDSFHKLHPDPVSEALTGGLLMLEDEKWATHRKIVNPSFHMEKLKTMVPDICLSCSIMTEAWDARISSDGGKSLEIDVWPYLENLSGDVISRTAFGSNFEEGKRVFVLQNELVKLVFDMITYIFIPGWRYVPTKGNRRKKEIDQEIRSLLRSVVNRRKREMEAGESIKVDLLSLLMGANMQQIGNKGLSIDEVVEECKLFYFAGSETTSSLIVWAMVVLSKHTEWQERAREEVMQVLGHDQPTYEGLARLKIVNMILLEVLRLYPPLSLTSRSPTKTVKLGNLTVPKGVDLLILISLLHYDRETWGEDANVFRPDRFSKGITGAVKNPFSYIPFGAGPRICIGQNLAMIQAKVCLAMVLQRFSFELGSSYVHNPYTAITLKPQHGAPLRLHKLR